MWGVCVWYLFCNVVLSVLSHARIPDPDAGGGGGGGGVRRADDGPLIVVLGTSHLLNEKNNKTKPK